MCSSQLAPNPSSNTHVLIIGASTTGLCLALELALRKCPYRIVERREGPIPINETRASTIQCRSFDILRQFGISREELIATGGLPLTDICFYKQSDMSKPLAVDNLTPPTAPLSPIQFSQSVLERMLLAKLASIPGASMPEYGVKLTGFAQDGETVTSKCRRLSDDGELVFTSRFLIGCDGGKSVVRKMLGLKLEGKTYPDQTVLDCQFASQPPLLTARCFFSHDCRNFFTVDICNPAADVKGPGSGRRGQFCFASRPGDPDVWTVDSINKMLKGYFGDGPDALIGQVEHIYWQTAFHMHNRSAPIYHVGNVILAGDAKSVVTPLTGTGMNWGIIDAHNLGWKLAQDWLGLSQDLGSRGQGWVSSTNGKAGTGEGWWVAESYTKERRAAMEDVYDKLKKVCSLMCLVAPGPVQALRSAFLGLLIKAKPGDMAGAFSGMACSFRSIYRTSIFSPSNGLIAPGDPCPVPPSSVFPLGAPTQWTAMAIVDLRGAKNRTGGKRHDETAGKAETQEGERLMLHVLQRLRKDFPMVPCVLATVMDDSTTVTSSAPEVRVGGEGGEAPDGRKHDVVRMTVPDKAGTLKGLAPTLLLVRPDWFVDSAWSGMGQKIPDIEPVLKQLACRIALAGSKVQRGAELGVMPKSEIFCGFMDGFWILHHAQLNLRSLGLWATKQLRDYTPYLKLHMQSFGQQRGSADCPPRAETGLLGRLGRLLLGGMTRISVTQKLE